MSIRRFFPLTVLASALALTSIWCGQSDIPPPGASSGEQVAQDLAEEMTSAAARTAAAKARSSSTPTHTPPPSETPRADTPTPMPVDPPVFAATDPPGDAYLCASGDAVDDSAVDILGLAIYEPSAWGSDHDGWLARIELGVPANQTFAEDWSASVLLAYAPAGATAYTLTVIEVHAGESTMGTFDAALQSILPDTADRVYLGDEGYVWYLIPRETTYLGIQSFHTPSEDLPPDQKRCDVAPDQDQYTLEFSSG